MAARQHLDTTQLFSQGLSAAVAAEDQACQYASKDGGRDHENPSMAARRGCGPCLVQDAPGDALHPCMCVQHYLYSVDCFNKIGKWGEVMGNRGVTYINVGNSQIINKNAILENKGSSTGIPVFEGTSQS